MSGNRLKRKLVELGVDVSSKKASESFCLIGTPLPPLEKSKDTGEFVPLWKQDVRDEKGRRRLHGAFTGGFSAGYFNSVGSKEGWTPSTFTSSRGERAKQKVARPEDFMDEEDLQELKESRVLVDTTDEMDLSGGHKVGLEDSEQDSITAALAASLLPPPADSAGARMLRKMGWRPGQGIGPRITLRQRKLQDMQASLGHRAPTVVDIPEDDEEAAKHTYAPRDTPVLQVPRKDNSHGLGYIPGLSLNESLGVKGSSRNTGPKLAAGFGLGALNDADEDDLDVYDGDPSRDRRREAYDNIERENDDNIIIRGMSDKHKETHVRPASSSFTFRDGTPVLPDFILSDKPVSEDRWFPLPEIPKGWTPDPRRVWNNDQNKENIQKPVLPSNLPGKRNYGMSANDRGAMLGETPLSSAPRSVFEFMSQKDRERLQKFASNTEQQTQTSHPVQDPTLPATPSSAPDVIRIARTEPHIAEAALRGFQPFAADPTKQARYKAYLESQASQDSSVPPLKPTPGQRIDEFNKEVEDYAKAALLFKPMSGAMAGRFTSAAIIDHGPKVHEGLHTPTAQELKEKEAEAKEAEENNISPKAHAARMSMYGPLTREVKPWQPARLLCKRFGVKDPNPPPETAADTSKVDSSNLQQSEFQASAATTGVSETTGSGRTGPRDLSNVGLGEDEDQGRDTLTYQRPAMDVFKAIFASDDEDSDDGKEPDADDDESAIPPQTKVEEQVPTVPSVAVTATNTMVDLSTFKPTFIPRDSKKSKDKDKDKEKKEKEKEKEKRKKGKSVLVSFEMDEEGATGPSPKPAKDRPKKKKRKEKPTNDDDAMWVEKPAPDAVKSLVLNQLPPDPPPSELTKQNGNEEEVQPGGPTRGRKRAIDFM